jgi:LysW-gamma-L-alpha-aminoadipyl-6-phosphate/LysW-L-glutamyl-5-phosphate reductase
MNGTISAASGTISAAIVGASGYVGGELLRLLLGHPRVELVAATSERLAGRRVDGVHPNVRQLTDLVFRRLDEIPDHDVTFLAASRTTAMATVPGLLRRSKHLFDLSPDFRLADPGAFARYYGVPHTAPDLLSSFTMGLPELHRQSLASADRISVPGCMATAAILALWPLARAGLVDGRAIVDGRIGSSGSGASAGPHNLHAERSGAMRVFAAAGHRHEAEIAQSTGLPVRMTATGVEAVRGAQVLCHVQTRRAVDSAAIRGLYRRQYAEEPFVRLVAALHGGYRLPEPKILSGSNFCDVGFAVGPDGHSVTAIAALDNLGKGGPGNAVQCLNIRMGWEERLGLGFPGLHPVLPVSPAGSGFPPAKPAGSWPGPAPYRRPAARPLPGTPWPEPDHPPGLPPQPSAPAVAPARAGSRRSRRGPRRPPR